MIRHTTFLQAMTVLVLLSSVVYSQPDSTGTSNDTVAIEVLEERVKGNAENSQNQVEALQKQHEAQTKAINQRINDHKEDSNQRIDTILILTGFFLTFLTAFITFFGRKTLAEWIKKSISDKTDVFIKRHESGLVAQTEEATAAFMSELGKSTREATAAFMSELGKSTKEATVGFMSELEKEAKEAREEWAKLDKARDEYESLKDRLEKKAKEIATVERPPVKPVEKIPDFQKKLSAVKDEPEYTARDWFVLAYQANKRCDFEEAITFYSHSIKLDPNNYWSYHNRGNNFAKLELYDEALKDYDKAIELDHKYASAHVNRGSILARQGRGEEALRSYEKALDTDPDDQLVLQNIAEAKLMLGQYDDALQKASEALAISETSKDKAISLYLKCIAEKLLDKDTAATEAEFERILEEDLEVDWSFSVIEGWLEKADISDEDRDFIMAKTAMLKAKKKKR